jgi:3'-phosphoadenosine 5'-phosphosulfate sulfotransferase (PAPS reductase)/FAD synthetase
MVVCFANTGREEEQTLEFVRDCGDQWGIPITWLEYRDAEQKYAIVSYETASRNGEPFEALIKKRRFLPNPVSRFCTAELKIRTMHRYLRSLGWAQSDGWDQFIGIRADEPRRIAKLRTRQHTETKYETTRLPLADAGVTIVDVQNFWDTQPFQLQLATHNGRTLAGNCDLCFLKATQQTIGLIAERPQRAIWWMRMEALSMANTPNGTLFRKDRPKYADLLALVQQNRPLFVDDDESIPCFCGD